MDTPPAAPQRPHVVSAHDDDRQDPWFWLRERDDPAVLAYLEAENAYTDARLEPLAPFRTGLFDEMKARIKETDMSVPARRGPWWYCAHRGGAELRHPLPPAGPGRRRAPPGRRTRPRGAGPPRRERAGRRLGLLRRGKRRGEPRPQLAGLLDRPHRGREVRAALHAARRRDPAHGRGRGRAGNRVRAGLVGPGRPRLLRPPGRGAAPVPAVAPPPWAATRRPTSSSSKSPTAASPWGSARPATRPSS